MPRLTRVFALRSCARDARLLKLSGLCFIVGLVWCGDTLSTLTIHDLPYLCTTGYRKISNHMLPYYSDWVSQGCNLSYSYEYDPTSNDLTSCIQYCSSTSDCKGFVIHVHEYGEDEYSYYGDHSGCWFTSCDNFSPGYFYYYDDSMDTFLKDDECYAACYPNSTLEVTNPHSVFTHAMAVQNQGISTASKCTVTMDGQQILVTDCSLDTVTTLFLSDRTDGDDDLFVGQNTLSASIECSDISADGVTRGVTNLLGATLPVTTEDPVTPSFVISSAIRTGSSTGAEVSAAMVGEELYWTIDIPADYSGRPTCTAYSGISSSGSRSQQLIFQGCSSNADLVGDFDNEASPTALVKRLWTTLYAFRFYNGVYLYIECSVKLCPATSFQCDFSCSRRKRNVQDQITTGADNVLKTGVLLQISAGGNGASTCYTRAMWMSVWLLPWIVNTVVILCQY